MKLGTATVTAIYLGTTSIVSAYLGSTQVFGGASAFTPLSLFSSGSQGIWLDPSDLTTMFSDRAGTTAVTTPGTVVGLRLDKSKGLALGSVSTASSWTNSASAWDVFSSTGGAFTAEKTVGGGTDLAYSNTFPFVLGNWYEVTINVASTTLSSYLVQLTATTNGRSTAAQFSGTGVKTALIQANTSSGNFSLAVSTTFLGSISVTSVSVRELPGKHAVAPTDAARPVYGVEPKAGRRNLLTFSEDYSNAIWKKSGTTATAGVLTESSASDFHGASQSFTYLTADYTFAVDFKPNGRDWVVIQARNNFSYFGLMGAGSLGTTAGTITSRSITLLPDGYYRCVITVPATAGNNNVTIYLASANGTVSYTGNGTSGVFLRNAQLELGSTATAYQRTTTAYDVTESGVATCHYVQYDGSDDSMSTAAIDFTATDKMSVFAGVRKLSDAAAGIIVEHSANATSNNGVFNLYTFTTPSNVFTSKGTIAREPLASSAPAPLSIIMTGLGDISGDLATLRINGAQVAQSTADQGTGTFGNYPLFIGRRNNTSLPFNGKDYGIVIVGKAASAGEITDTETWLAARTAQVTI